MENNIDISSLCGTVLSSEINALQSYQDNLTIENTKYLQELIDESYRRTLDEVIREMWEQ